MSVIHLLTVDQGWFIVLGKIFVPESFLVGNEIIFYISLFVITTILVISFVIGFYFSVNKYKLMWALPFLRGACSLTVGALFIPLISVFSSMLVDCTDQYGSHVSCWQGVLLFRSIANSVVGILFLGLSFILTLTYYEQDPTSKTVLSRPHSRIEVYYLVMRAIMTIFFTVLDPETDVWFLFILSTALGFIGFFLYTWYIPYYRFHYCVTKSISMAVFSWANVCLLFSLIHNDPETDEMGLIFFIGSPLAGILAWYMIDSRRKYLMNVPLEQLKNPFYVELKARFALEEAGLLFITPKAARENNMLDHHLVYRQVNRYYIKAAKIFPSSSSLYLFWGHFYLFFMENRHMALTTFGRVEDREPRIDEEFIIYRRRRSLSEGFSESGSKINFII
jgi:hypothetical protein